ncbi:hypothetical protein FRB99_007246 [Tulasnella sp. 403]|nr:hypothetical protein FRB99_007246 [Tulasnella sp. 403]
MDDDVESSWKLFESDPACFNELLSALNVKGLVVDDLYSLDAASLAALQPLHALVFLFKWVSETDEKGGIQGTYDEEFPGFFMKQVVNNACATIAVLNGLFNIPDVEMGPQLRELLDFSASLDYETRGEVFTSSDFLRTAHNSLIPPSAISLSNLGLPKSSEDAFHFVVYLPHLGAVYELDGLKHAPINHGAFEEKGEGWAAKAREVIEHRIATYPPGSLHFNLLAIRGDPLPELKSQLQAAIASGENGSVEIITEQIHMEEQKRANWAFENSLRRHNHLGLIHSLLLGLAQAGGLEQAITGAKVKYKERRERAKKDGSYDSMED